ncbi:unnamed protein product, partial [Polarella glacialis]
MVFTLAYYLNKACRTQLLVGEQPTCQPSEQIWAHARSQMLEKAEFAPGVEWPAVEAYITGSKGRSHQAASGSKEEDEESEEEWKVRVALSDAHKELNQKGLDELIWNHISAKCGGGLLITAGDRLWDSMEPETLVKSS